VEDEAEPCEWPDGVDDLGTPVLVLEWNEDTPLGVDSPPLLVDFRDGHGLEFDHDAHTYLEIEEGMAGAARFTGAFTVTAEVRLDSRPDFQAAVVSHWRVADLERSYELGVDRTQYPYLVVSATGYIGENALMVTSDRQLRLGETYQVAAVFDPAETMAVYIDGQLTGDVAQDVPASAYDCDTPFYVGNRPGGTSHTGFDGVIGRVELFDEALDGPVLATRACLRGLDAGPPGFPPVRTITSGPRFHWFGYYDKFEFDPTGRYVLGNSVDFENRPPEPDDVIEVGMVDLEDGDRWIYLGETRAWSWQQGCMLQWRPGSDSEVMWNDREDETGGSHFVTRILDLDTGMTRTLPRPFYHVSPHGDIAVGTDFSRIDDMRRGYGYSGVPDPYYDVPAPEGSTVYAIDLETGECRDLVSLADLAAIPFSRGDFGSGKHWVNHLQFNTDGSRFMFLHRWRTSGGGFDTRAFVMSPDGTGLTILTEDPGLSHFHWRDESVVSIWTASRGGYALYEDGVGYVGPLFGYVNGHQTYMAGGEWLLSDTYPDEDRFQHPFLYNLLTGEIFVLGHFYSPPEYAGEWRVDTHPRSDRTATSVVIDSPHTGGRQLHLIDVSGITGY
jgi:hypothetical protein